MKRLLIMIALVVAFGALYAQDAADAAFMDKMTATAADATEADATATDATAADATAADATAADATAADATAADATEAATADTAAAAAETTVAFTVGTAQSDRYTVISELGGEDAQKLATTLEAYFMLYNSYFHFDATLLTSMLQARAFASKEAFDAYLTQVIGSTKDDFVYLHYPSLERSELLIFPKGDAEDYELSLAHQAFVQYLKAFAPGAPLWLREGFAVYFEESRVAEGGTDAVYKQNLSWLETVKSYRTEKSLIPLGDFLSLSSDAAKQKLQVFYPQSWAFVAYLLESDYKDANRFLWDAVAKLSRDKGADETQAKIYEMAKAWPGINDLEKNFDGFLEGKRTFPEMVAYGIELFNKKEYDAAEDVFNAAVEVDGSNHVPYYYLGLIAYYAKKYAFAEAQYQQSLALGCEAGIGNYALGVNAFVMGRTEDARSYLTLAKEAAPGEYGTKADEILARIK